MGDKNLFGGANVPVLGKRNISVLRDKTDTFTWDPNRLPESFTNAINSYKKRRVDTSHPARNILPIPYPGANLIPWRKEKAKPTQFMDYKLVYFKNIVEPYAN